MGSPPGHPSKQPHVALAEGIAHISAQVHDLAKQVEQLRAELTRQSPATEPTE